MDFLNKLSYAKHAELCGLVVGDTLFLNNYTFKVIECNRRQDSNFAYDEYILSLYDSPTPRYFTCNVVYTIFSYDDWGYEEYIQNYDFIEVVKQEMTTYAWVQKL